METRECHVCQRKYKVMTSSKQVVCSTACVSFGTRVHGGLKKQSKNAEKKTETVNVDFTEIRQHSEPKKAFVASSSGWITAKKRKSELDALMKEIDEQEMKEEQSGPEKTEIVKEPSRKGGTNLTKTSPVSEDSFGLLKTESSNSMNLLSKSANVLMTIIETQVTADDVTKANEGVKNIDPSKIETTIECAKMLATTVQTQVNMVKAMTSLMK